MKNKTWFLLLLFVLTVSLILFGIKIYTKHYFNRIAKVYNASQEMLVNNNEFSLDIKNNDEKYIYQYFKDINNELIELNKLSYSDYKNKYLNHSFYKDIDVSKNDINTYFQNEKQSMDNIKNKLSKEEFLKYLKSNNVSKNVIAYLDSNIDENIFDVDGVIKRIDSDKKEFDYLLEYADYLNSEKSNWSIKNGNIISDNEQLINEIKNRNVKIGININVFSKENDTPEVDKSKRIPILMYHGVSDETWGIEKLFIKVSDFESQMKYIHDNYETIFIEDIEKDYSNKKVVALTFDDGYVDFYTNVFPILKKYNLKANLYVILNSRGGKFLDDKQIKEISTSGLVSIGSHTLNHLELKDLDDEKLETELKDSKEQLEQLINKKVKTICYPVGKYDSKVISATKKYYSYGLAIKNDVEKMNKEFNRYAIKRYRMYRDTSFEDFKKKVDMAN